VVEKKTQPTKTSTDNLVQQKTRNQVSKTKKKNVQWFKKILVPVISEMPAKSETFKSHQIKTQTTVYTEKNDKFTSTNNKKQRQPIPVEWKTQATTKKFNKNKTRNPTTKINSKSTQKNQKYLIHVYHHQIRVTSSDLTSQQKNTHD
jgi:hypothetical protein